MSRLTDADLCARRVRVRLTNARGDLYALVFGPLKPAYLRHLRKLAWDMGGTCEVTDLERGTGGVPTRETRPKMAGKTTQRKGGRNGRCT